MTTAPPQDSVPLMQRALHAWKDVGILLCCVLSLACRLSLFYQRRKRNERALRACCVIEEDQQDAYAHNLTQSFVQLAHQGQPQLAVNATCYADFLHTIDFADVRLLGGLAASLSVAEPERQGISRAEVRYILDHAFNDGAIDKNGSSVDPVLILLQLPLEQRLATLVNWFSVMSNCLTHYLRMSQVVYTFIFNMADFFLFVVSVAESRYRCQLLSDVIRSTDAMAASVGVAGDVTTAEPVHAMSHARRGEPLQERPSLRRRGAGGGGGAEANACARWGRRLALLCIGPFRCLIGSIVSTLTMTADALQPFVSSVPPLTPRPQSTDVDVLGECGPFARQLVDSEGAAGVPWLCPADAVEAAAQGPNHTGARELLLLNAALAFALLLFNRYHLFFGVGAVTGYVAAAANLFLLGCGLVTVSQQCGAWWHARTTCSSAQAWVCDGNSWRLRASHWFAAACAAFYFSMLLDEGDELWATHISCMRWYAATTALGVTEVLASFSPSNDVL